MRREQARAPPVGSPVSTARGLSRRIGIPIWRTGSQHGRKVDHFSVYTSVVRQEGGEACMARWSSECRLFAVASVALSCSACDTQAFALCEYCPDLLASTAIAYQAALPQRVQSTPLHDRYAGRWHQRRDDPLPPWLVFGAETVGSTASRPMDGGAPGATTPTARIDEFFNLMSVGESDQSEQVVALRASVLGQLLTGQASPSPSDRTGFLFPVLIAFGSSLLIGAALMAGRYTFATPPTTRGGPLLFGTGPNARAPSSGSTSQMDNF